MTTAICLKSIGNIAEFTFNGDLKTDNITKLIPKSVRRTIGYGKLKKQHEFLRGDVKISLFAWTDGEAGDENKHELPPPIDKYLYFGNSFLIAHKNNIPVNFKKIDFDILIREEYDDFEELGSEDSWSTDETISDTDSINDFIVNDDNCD